MSTKWSESNEFFFYNPKQEEDGIDFTGDERISSDDRREFLRRYADFMEHSYHIPEAPEKVVTPEELKSAMEGLQGGKVVPELSKRLDFSHMHAGLKKVFSDYEGWSFYTQKVRAEADTLIFADEELPPSPAAMYCFSAEKRLEELEFSFWMSGKYKAEITGGILDTTPGRTVELRRGIQDLIKLQFYSNGTCYARLGKECPYHLKNIEVGRFAFDEWTRIKIVLEEDKFSVSVNGQMSEKLDLPGEENPDTLFIGCGMFQVGEWRICPERMRFSDTQILSFFQKSEKGKDWLDAPEIDLGEVELPFRVGGEKRKDQALILEKSFSCQAEGRAVLNLETLDPGGVVFINDNAMWNTDSFEAFSVDITDFLRKGENRIRIVVYPRAPEVLFGWHRQQDPYNGWFCGNVSVSFIHEIQILHPEVTALEVKDRKVRCSFRAETSKDCEMKVFIRKIFPAQEQEERLIVQKRTQNRFLQTEEVFDAEPWTVEKPVLYAVRFTADGVDDVVTETGFRTISQENGRLLLNGIPFVLKGALLMQFLPPYEETSSTHICPLTEQILWQELMLRKMNGNTMRMHVLGYGTNDRRYAELADRLGVLLIWTTRYIDSIEQMAWQEEWTAKEGYQRQMRELLNHPSIIMWEGANEYHPSLREIDRMYEAFVPAVKEMDSSRLICPISHLYYAGDMIPKEGCSFYNDTGTKDHLGRPATASRYWTDALVVRSAHTYEILLGYGSSWEKMRKQSWSMQPELLKSRERAYIVSEFAVIGMQNPNTPEAGKYFNAYSYEEQDDDVLGFRFSAAEWRESQAYQALAAKAALKTLLLNGADGMLWCCLMGGANDGGYRKPVIDNYGYPKMAYYALQEEFQDLFAAAADVDVFRGKNMVLRPVVFGTKKGEIYRVQVVLMVEEGNMVEKRVYPRIVGEERMTELEAWKPKVKDGGYYGVRYEVEGSDGSVF